MRAAFDVLVVGSGPAGCAAAISLADAGVSVAMLHRASRARAQSIGEHLAPMTKAHLQRLGLDTLLSDPRHCPSQGVRSAWGAPELRTKDYIFDPYGCGWNLDRAAFDQALLDCAHDRGVHLVEITRLGPVEHGNGACVISATTAAEDRALSARFLIDATGRTAAIARRLGAVPKRYDRLVALHVRLHSANCDAPHLLVEAVQDGWWYSTPLAGGDVVVVFMTDNDFVPADSARRAAFWLAQLESAEATGMRVGGASARPQLRVSPACSQCLSIHAGSNWLAVGDASMAFDPLAAVGVAKALEDGLNAADTVSAALAKGAWVPERYSEARRDIFDAYLGERANYYRLEQRWAESAFWRRRQSN